MSAAMTLTLAFEGHAMRFATFRGRPCVIAKDLGAALGYSEAGFRRVCANWESEFIEDVDRKVLTGEDLAEFLGGLDVSAKMALSRAPHLTIFFEPGFNMICLKTEKECGVKLRRFFAGEVMPKLMRGEPIGQMTPGLSEERVLALIAASQAQFMAELTKRIGGAAPSDDPFAGKNAAEEYVLAPLRRYVAMKLWLLRLDKSKRSKIWFDAEKALRKAVGYPRGDGTTWSRLPESKLAHAANVLLSMISDVRRDLQNQGRPETPDDALPLFQDRSKSAKRKRDNEPPGKPN